MNDNAVLSPLLMIFNVENNCEGDEVDYGLSGIFYREILSAENRKNLIANIIKTMKNNAELQKDDRIKKQLYHFFRIDTLLGLTIAEALKVKVASVLLS